MKSIFLSIIISLIFNSGNAQTPGRFPIDSSSVWRVDHIRNGVSDEVKHESGDDISKYFFRGDTLINAKKYFKLFKTGTSWFDAPFYYENVYQGALRDENNEFYYVAKKNSNEIILYDFNVAVDDTIQVPYDGVFETKVVSSVDTLFDGRRLIHFNPKTPIMGCGDQYFIEGIGGSGGLLEGPACNHFWTNDNHLVCFVQDDLLMYHDYNFQFNCDVIKPITNYLDSLCVWRIDKQCENDQESDYERLIYFTGSDTLIGNHHYFKLFKSGYQLLIHDNGSYFSGYNDSVYVGALREEYNKLFFLEKDKISEKLLYDFNLNQGDIITADIYNGDTIMSVGTILDNRKLICMSENFYEKNLLQGIGSDKGLLENKNENSRLICFMKDKVSVYHFDGSGTECGLTYSDLSFSDCDKIKVIPANPKVGDNIKLAVRTCYSVSFDHPAIPILSNCEKRWEDNGIIITLTCDYDDQKNLSETKMLVPLFDTIQIGNLDKGNYYVDLLVNTNHFGSGADFTVERDKGFYAGFEVVTTNSIIPFSVEHEIKVYPIPSTHLVNIENNNSDLVINSISIFNILGERMEKITLPALTNQEAIKIDMESYKNGFYLLQLTANGVSLMKRIILE